MTHFRHGQWVDDDGAPLELEDYQPEVGQQADYTEEPEQSADKPKRTRSAKKDPREGKDAQ